MTLKKELVKLANKKPETRQHLVPLLKKSSLMKVGPVKVDQHITQQLQNFKKLRARYSPSDLSGALISAAHYAKRFDETMFVYSGNSYGSFVYRVTQKKSEYLSPINNTGGIMHSVTPDRVVSTHELIRPF